MDINIKNETIKKLKKYIFLQEFDTESVNIDIQINNGNANIDKNINDKQCIHAIITKFDKSRRMFFILFLVFIFLSPKIKNVFFVVLCMF